MTFFYDLNKRLAGLAGKQELTEGKKPDFLDVDKDGNKEEPMKKALKDKELDEASYSAKAARAGKDIGKPGKAFSKIAADAAERYGSKERGEKVAGAVLKKLRAKTNEADMEEGNEFSGELAKAKASGAKSFEVDGKEYPVKEAKGKSEKKNAFDPEVARSMFAPEKGKTKTGHTVHDTGYSKRYTKKLDDEPDTDDELGDAPKQVGGSGIPKKKGRKAVGAGRGTKIGAKVKGTSKLASKGAIAEGEAECCPHCGHELVAEKAVSQQQQKFMGMAHAMQKGEKIKGASPELKKVAKTMKKSDVEDFAATKHKGLPKKVKEEEVEETADAPKAKKSSGGIQFGKGVYEAMNDNLEKVISESMNVNVSMSTNDAGEPTKSITVSAEGEQAEMLAQLLNLAGLQGQTQGCSTCGVTPCGCEQQVDEVDENNPDWPTDEETTGNNDPQLTRWAGGLNKPKETGQTTAPVVNRDPARGSVGPKEMAEATDLGLNLYAELKSFKAK